MILGLDLVGGDHVPNASLEGVYMFLESDDKTQLHVYGNEESLNQIDQYEDRIVKVSCTQTIEMNENPTAAFRNKQDSTIVRGIRDVHNGKTDAYISAGNTGAMLVSSVFIFQKELENIRPVIASPMPRVDGDGYNFIIDVGLNADCKPDYLVEFAKLGTSFIRSKYGIENPEVGLLNIGEEENKGNILTKEAYKLLKMQEGINFKGNIEGRDIFLDRCRIIICDGFVGNIILKLSESIYTLFHDNRGIDDDFLYQFNYELYGGTPILGIPKPIIIGHGNSSALAFKEMLVNAAIYTEKQTMAEVVSSI